ncbi:MAG: hypothetical protein Q9224_005021, partial [Gallowayella concinna]
SYEDRSSHVIGSAIVLIILPTVAVILRLLSRWMSKAGLWVRWKSFMAEDLTAVLTSM